MCYCKFVKFIKTFMESADTGTLSEYKKKVMRSIHEVLLWSVFARHFGLGQP